MTYYDTLDSPIGPLTLAGCDEVLTDLLFPINRYEPKRRVEWQHRPGAFAAAKVQLQSYFAGELREFDVPIALDGTPFQRRVWAALCTIPYGRTWSYSELAAHIEQPKAVRAVGLANGRNPLPIIVPCHRVIGANGGLTGFGGGLAVKRFLLAREAEQSFMR